MTYKIVVCVVSALVATVCGLINQNYLNDLLFDGDYTFIDLTYSFDNNTVYWPNIQKFEFTKNTEHEQPADGSWYAAKEFAAGEHGGTHIDAPYHFMKSGAYVADIPLEKLIVPLDVFSNLGKSRSKEIKPTSTNLLSSSNKIPNRSKESHGSFMDVR
ncbi:hypothetical protein ACJJTC_016140 [Scirpophaga incertulas]